MPNINLLVEGLFRIISTFLTFTVTYKIYIFFCTKPISRSVQAMASLFYLFYSIIMELISLFNSDFWLQPFHADQNILQNTWKSNKYLHKFIIIYIIDNSWYNRQFVISDCLVNTFSVNFTYSMQTELL